MFKGYNILVWTWNNFLIVCFSAHYRLPFLEDLCALAWMLCFFQSLRSSEELYFAFAARGKLRLRAFDSCAILTQIVRHYLKPR